MNNFTKVQIRKTTKANLDKLQKRLESALTFGKISQPALMIWLVDLGNRELDKLENQDGNSATRNE